MSEFITTLLTIIGSVGGAASLSAIFKFIKDGRGSKKTNFDTMLLEYKELYSKSEVRIEELENKYDVIVKSLADSREEVAELTNKLILMEASHNELPVPFWFKDSKFKLVSFNDAFGQFFIDPFGKNGSDYRHKTDDEFFGELDGGFVSNVSDSEVIKMEKPVFVVEEFRMVDGAVLFLHIVKFPRFVGNAVVGVSGLLLGTYTDKNNVYNLLM